MDKLTPNHFSFQCPMNWDEMAITERGRFCGKCRKEVLDLTHCSIDEVSELQRKHGSICGSIRVAVATVALSTAACQPRQHLMGEIAIPPSAQDHTAHPVVGKIKTPEY